MRVWIFNNVEYCIRFCVKWEGSGENSWKKTWCPRKNCWWEQVFISVFQVGIEAWKNARDSTGLTPHDYACIRGHYSYVHLVQRKLDKKSGNGHIILDIPTTAPENNSGKAVKFATFNTEANMARSLRRCGQCEQKLAHGSPQASLSMYRPAMISLVLIAAVCVCAALLFKSSPEVLCSTRPFRWDVLEYGSQ